MAAGLSVADDGGGKPRFGKWQPYDRPSSTTVSLPVRETESPATLVPSELEPIQEPAQ